MKILIVTQYFWPETFRINDLALGLKERGHQVEILTGKPNYPKGKFFEGYSFFKQPKEVWKGIKIHRANLVPRGNSAAPRLFLNYITFAMFASLKVPFIKGKFDKIFVYEPSPITVGIPALLSKLKFGAPVYFWVQDLWPESLMAAGGVRNKYVLGFFDSLTRYIYKHCETILIQSNGFRNYIAKQGVDSNKIVYFPNSTESLYKAIPKDERYEKELPKGFRLMFAGNIGEAQSFDTLLNAAKILNQRKRDIKWIILGEGRMKEYVEQRIEDLHLKHHFFLIGAYPVMEMPKFFSCADGLLVSLKKNKIFALTIPSKVQSYLACGKPIIASLDGEGAKITEEANSGFVAEAENATALADAVEMLYGLSGEERQKLGENARAYFEREFEREVLISKLEEILQK